MHILKILTLDVLGHAPDECKDHDCRCMVGRRQWDGDSVGIVAEHDENRCECGFDVNDVHDTGKVIEVLDLESETLLAAMVEHGFLDSWENDKALAVVCEEIGETQFSFNLAESGMPLYQAMVESSPDGDK